MRGVAGSGGMIPIDFSRRVFAVCRVFNWANVRPARRRLSRSKFVLLAALTWAAWASSLVNSRGADARRLLIVAPDAFRTVLHEFVSYKQKILPTEFYSLEQIFEKTAGEDDPAKLKRFLYDQWRNRHLGYALLVGDVDVLPVRYMVLDRITPAAQDYAFYPSDLYYSDLAHADGSFDDWNGNKHSYHASYFGEVRGEKNKQDPINYDAVDYRPDIAVGRWPVSTPEEARLVAAKTMAYETSVLAGRNTWLHRAAFLVTAGWVDTRSRLDEMSDELEGPWQIEKRYYSDGRRQSGTPPPNRAEVRDILNSGVGLVVHTGHGQPMGWERCFS